MAKKTDPVVEFDEALKPYAAEAENALDRFFTSGLREDAAHFFYVLDEMRESARQDKLTDGLKGLAAIGKLTRKAANA